MTERSQHHGKYCPGISASLGEQEQMESSLCAESCRVCEGKLSWGSSTAFLPEQLSLTLDWSFVLPLLLAVHAECPFLSRKAARDGLHCTGVCSAAIWLIAGTGIATANKIIPQQRLKRSILVWCSWRCSVELQFWTRIPPWYALCMQWGKGDDQRRWWSRILFLCLI